MENTAFAHTDPASKGDTSQWEPLFTADPVECPALIGKPCSRCETLYQFHGHLNKVAWWTAKFVEQLFPPGSDDARAGREWGYLVGLWHDLGKFAPLWQAYLRKKGGADSHHDEVSERMDHATAGAQHAVKVGKTLGHLLAYAISGHHSGLLDAISDHACLEKRFATVVNPYDNAPAAVLNRAVPALPPSMAQEIVLNPAVGMLFTRMIFSSLVDADFLATEAFMNPAQSADRPKPAADLLPQMLELLDRHLDSFSVPVDGTATSPVTSQTPASTDRSPMSNALVNRARADVLAACRVRAQDRPGLFSLTVPTGGGKTLSSLAFALRHAVAHGLHRVIYVIPFTSIIEQNAAVFEGVFQPLIKSVDHPVVLQHHSNLSPKDETDRTRLAAENWDAPLVVTTAVQFYESLHAARTSGCRKLHHIANTVVILDEAQCLPVEYLHPCLDLLRELSKRYRTTVVLCTATQPEIGRSAEFKIGLDDVREIVPDRAQLYNVLRRVKVIDRGALTDEALAAEIADCPQVLAIVNTRGHAQKLFKLLPPDEGNFHLSARMCPAHRKKVLNIVRARLERGEPVRLISTQLIEAGVDVDFPRVYRALAGIDSLAQAAGRCNRNGRMALGELHIFRSEHPSSEAYFRDTAEKAEQVLELHGDDPLGLDAVRRFFRLYYLDHRPSKGFPWDGKAITHDYKVVNDRSLPFQFQFDEVAKKFRLIENDQVSIIIPFDEQAKSLLKDLRNENIPLNRKLLRGLQQYTVQIYQPEFVKNRLRFESLREDQFHFLSFDGDYSPMFGLSFGDPTTLLYVGD